MLSNFTEEDIPHLSKTLDKLVEAADIMDKCDTHIPYPVQEILRHYSAARH